MSIPTYWRVASSFEVVVVVDVAYSHQVEKEVVDLLVFVGRKAWLVGVSCKLCH